MRLRLLQRSTADDPSAFTRDLWNIPSVRETWTRLSSAYGGYLSGSFELSGLTESDIKDFFDRYLGYVVQEHAYNELTWNGFIYRMTLELNGAQYVRTLEPDWFHNKVKAFYSNVSVVDTEQGVLNYLAAPLRFQDTLQDFSAWETLAGDAAYRIQVANADGTTSWGYLGASSTVTNPNDTIAIYQDIALGTTGWNDQDPIGPPAMTAVSYQVIEIRYEGAREQTDWAQETDSQTAFGIVEYVLSLGGTEQTAADALRDRHITEFGFPRTRMVGSIDIEPGSFVRGARLIVECAGFVATLFWRYRYSSRTADVATQLAETVSLSQFVYASTDTVEANALITTIDCYPMPQRLGDLVQILVDQGDAAGNSYQWGVYGRWFYYEAQPTEPSYTFANGKLYDMLGTQVIPQLLRPGFLLESKEAPVGIMPFGGADIDKTSISYVEQVEFSAPNRLRLTLAGQSGLAETTASVAPDLLKTVGRGREVG